MALAACAGLVALSVAPRVAAQGPSPDAPTTTADPRTERQQVLGQRAELAAELDVLQASEAELQAALADLEANVVAAEQALVDADRNLAAAEAAAQLAAQEADDARAWVGVVRTAVSRMAVDAYIEPPGERDLDVFESVSDANEQVLKQTFLDLHRGDQADLLDELRGAIAAHDERRRDAELAATAAASSATELEQRLVQLNVAKAQQEGLVRGIQARIDSRLAEAEALATLDAELAASIREQELLLLASLSLPDVPPPSAPPPLPGAPPATPPTTTPGSPGTTSTTGPVATPSTGGATTTVAPTSTTAPTGPTTSTTLPGGPAVIVSVRGIWVAQSIAGQLERLLAAAEADGIVLRGGGYRDPAFQIELRKAHCGPTDYDIWIKPASECHPPTARPGTSMHEQGLAVDFTHNGKVITSRTSPAFLWLVEHAGSYGFFNLPSEPWHWSINGH